MTIGRLWKEGVKVAIHCRMFIQGGGNCTNYSGWCQLYKLYKYFWQMSITSSLMSNLWTTNTCLDELIYHRRYISSLVSLLGGSKNLCQCWISCYLLFIIHFWKTIWRRNITAKSTCLSVLYQRLFSCHICNCFNTEQNLFLFDLFNNPVLWSHICVIESTLYLARVSCFLFLFFFF